MMLADTITYMGREWKLWKGHVPATYRYAHAEVYAAGGYWHCQCQTPGDWRQLDLYGGHPDPATAIKHVHRVLGWTADHL